MAFFRAQPYAWRRPQLDEVARLKIGQSSLMGDLFRALGQVGEAHFMEKERQAELARQKEQEDRRRMESDRAYELDVAESLDRMNASPAGHRIARAIKQEVPSLPVPIGMGGGAIQTGPVTAYKDATIDDLYERGLPVPVEVPGFGRIEIPPDMVERFRLGEQEYYSTPSPRDVAALLREGRLTRAEERRLDAQTAAIKDRGLLADRIRAAGASVGMTPEQTEALAAAVQMDEAPAGAISGVLRPPRSSSSGSGTSGKITDKDLFNAQKQWLANVEREVDRRVAESQRAAKDRPYVLNEKTGKYEPATVLTREEARRQIEEENGWQVGGVSAAKTEILGGRPFPAHFFPGADFTGGGSGAGLPALDQSEVDAIVAKVAERHLDHVQVRNLMREWGYDDNEIKQVLNELVDRGIGSRMGPEGE